MGSRKAVSNVFCRVLLSSLVVPVFVIPPLCLCNACDVSADFRDTGVRALNLMGRIADFSNLPGVHYS